MRLSTVISVSVAAMTAVNAAPTIAKHSAIDPVTGKELLIRHIAATSLDKRSSGPKSPIEVELGVLNAAEEGVDSDEDEDDEDGDEDEDEDEDEDDQDSEDQIDSDDEDDLEPAEQKEGDEPGAVLDDDQKLKKFIEDEHAQLTWKQDVVLKIYQESLKKDKQFVAELVNKVNHSGVEWKETIDQQWSSKDRQLISELNNAKFDEIGMSANVFKLVGWRDVMMDYLPAELGWVDEAIAKVLKDFKGMGEDIEKKIKASYERTRLNLQDQIAFYLDLEMLESNAQGKDQDAMRSKIKNLMQQNPQQEGAQWMAVTEAFKEYDDKSKATVAKAGKAVTDMIAQHVALYQHKHTQLFDFFFRRLVAFTMPIRLDPVMHSKATFKKYFWTQGETLAMDKTRVALANMHGYFVAEMTTVLEHYQKVVETAGDVLQAKLDQSAYEMQQQREKWNALLA